MSEPNSHDPTATTGRSEPGKNPYTTTGQGETGDRPAADESQSSPPPGDGDIGGPTADATSDNATSDNATPDNATPRRETRDEEMERLRAEVEAANKHALQAQADAENFRKRMRRDLEEQLRFAALPLINDLLQVRDNLHRALDAASLGGESTPASGLRDGVAMCVKQLDDVLKKYGATEIPAEGQPFDPNCHEAISQMPSPDHPQGTILHVATSGFRLHDRVIRPSQVVVSGGPAE